MQDISIAFLQHSAISICEKQSQTQVQLIHAEQMSLWNFIIHNIHICIYIYIYIIIYIYIYVYIQLKIK